MRVVHRLRHDRLNFVTQHVAQRIEAVHANVSQWASSSKSGVVDPGAGASHQGSNESGARQHRLANGARSDTIAKPAHAFLEAHYMGDAEHYFRRVRGFDHMACFNGIHRHRLLNEHWLALADGYQHIGEVKRIRRCNEYRVDVGRRAKLRSRSECVLYAKFASRLARPLRVAT